MGDIKYSLLISGQEVEKAGEAGIRDNLQKGIKIIVINDGVSNNVLRKLEIKCSYFYILDTISNNVPSVRIEDGSISSECAKSFDELCSICPKFNVEQYMVEHFSVSKNLIVRASAGTGKTTVMIDRIMYLLSVVDNINPIDICMITFTNKAADNMRSKLVAKLMERYKYTKSFKYLELMESLSGMDISTIDSFFNKLIKNEGTKLGYGQDISIRSFVYEKKKIVESVVNDLFKDVHGSYSSSFTLKIHEYVDLATKCWDVLNSRGYYLEDIKKMNFGCSESKSSDIINQNMKKIIIEAEKRYAQLKLNYNALTVSDLKVDIDNLVTSNEELNMRPYKYIFVDEFQDTDNSQIRSIAWLRNVMNCNVFVVGDVKQSIYRFRGAEETAFDRLDKALGHDCHEIYLKKNYRTASNIMKELNDMFRNWADNGLLKLEKGEDAIPTVSDSYPVQIVKYNKPSKQKSIFIDKIYEIMEWEKHRKIKSLDHDENSICILTRTNWQAHNIAQWLRDEKIPIVTSTEGGFFQQPAVLDMMHLLGAIVYSDNPVMLFNYIHTPYSNVGIKYSSIGSYNGNKKELLEYIKPIIIKDGWEKLVCDSKYKPFFQFIKDLIELRNPVFIYSQIRKIELEELGYQGDNLEQQLKYDVLLYELNLNKLIEKFSVIFSGEYASVLSAYEYLLLMTATNKSEDTVFPDIKLQDEGIVIQVMTVHKAKGLEFSSVLIPMTDFMFYKDLEKVSSGYCEFITLDNKKDDTIRLGWTYKANGKIYNNNNYTANCSIEQGAVIREELRILYVALTRTKNRLIYMRKNSTSDNTWGCYLK